MNKAFETLSTANKYIDNIKTGIKTLVDEINSGMENNAMIAAYAVFDGIEWLTNALRVTSDLQKENISMGNFNEILSEMIEAFENEDYVLISDLFQYELLPKLDNVQNDIRKIILN